MYTRLFKISLFVVLFVLSSLPDALSQEIKKIAPGVWSITYGTPEKLRPTDFKEQPSLVAMAKLPETNRAPALLSAVRFAKTERGTTAGLQMDDSERIYGFGMQVNTFEQRGMRREIRTNSWTLGNTGLGHEPMPFYISSRGYGILVNSSRYVTFYMGSQHKLEQSISVKEKIKGEMSAATSLRRYTISNQGHQTTWRSW